MPSDFYQRVLTVCQKHFGDDAQRFLDRQIESHLSKNADTLLPTDKEELSKWVKVSASLIMDAATADTITNEIKAL
ncbi:MAG TPA: hypothetical protein PKL83_04040 [bacterium]|nr:hypothetical protein [bacterium]